MPNRIIKESICSSDNVNELRPEVEIFFYRLIVNCDDYGRMDARPSILRAKCFPLRVESITESDISEWLNELVSNNIVKHYTVDNHNYIQFTTWEKHQQIRAHKSKYPAPDNSCNQMIADDSKCPRNPIQSESNPNPIRNTFDGNLPEWVDKDTFNDFLEMRRKIKASPTERAVKLLIADLEKLKLEGNEPNEVLNQSIKNNWRGLFALKNNGHTASVPKGKYDHMIEGRE